MTMFKFIIVNTVKFALVSAISALTAQGFTYQNRDVILVFRKDGFNDVEFNLGVVDRFLSLTNGQQLNITNWDSSLALSTYGDLTAGVQTALVASTTVNATDRVVWVTSGEPATIPVDRTPSQWQQLWSKTDAIGQKPAEFTQTNSAPSIAVSPTLCPSFTYIESNGGSAPGLVAKLGGTSAITVVATVPASLKFYEIRPSLVTPKPPSKLVGSFTITAQGALTFTAGSGSNPPLDATQITGVSAGTNAVTITFNTVAGAKYRLRYSDTLSANLAAWSVGTDSVAGAGAPASLLDHALPPKTRFYAVESFQ
jgi:hypothetical protein